MGDPRELEKALVSPSATPTRALTVWFDSSKTMAATANEIAVQARANPAVDTTVCTSERREKADTAERGLLPARWRALGPLRLRCPPCAEGIHLIVGQHSLDLAINLSALGVPVTARRGAALSTLLRPTGRRSGGPVGFGRHKNLVHTLGLDIRQIDGGVDVSYEKGDAALFASGVLR